MTDALGSILATFSNTAGSAVMLGNQFYGPYGNQLYQFGSMNTSKGYTGQYNDPVTGLDYYISRYYDPVAGVFLSADLQQGNLAGMNPYGYVDGNPETRNDPTGQAFTTPGGGGVGGNSGASGNTPPPTNTSSYTCAWYDLSCDANYEWNHITQFAQHVTNVVHQDITHPAQAAQQLEQIEQTVVHAISGAVAVVVAIVAAIIIGVAVFVFLHKAPQSWTRPTWADLEANEGVEKTRYIPNGQQRSSKQHVLRQHAWVNPSDVEARAINDRRNSSAFYDGDMAQWAVDYALMEMTAAQLQYLADMEANPQRGATLTLRGTAPTDVGYVYVYNRQTRQVTRVETANFRVIIGVDSSGKPYIITAYPEV